MPVLELQVSVGEDYKTLNTVLEVAQCLLYDFPREGRGEAYATALTVSLEYMEGGDSSTGDVRASFVEAAHEIDMLVLPDDGPDN